MSTKAGLALSVAFLCLRGTGKAPGGEDWTQARFDSEFEGLEKPGKRSLEGSWTATALTDDPARPEKKLLFFSRSRSYVEEENPGGKTTLTMPREYEASADGIRMGYESLHMRARGDTVLLLGIKKNRRIVRLVLERRPAVPPERWTETWRPGGEAFAKFKRPPDEARPLAERFLKALESSKAGQVLPHMDPDCLDKKGKKGGACEDIRLNLSGSPAGTSPMAFKLVEVKPIAPGGLAAALEAAIKRHSIPGPPRIDETLTDRDLGHFQRSLLGGAGFPRHPRCEGAPSASRPWRPWEGHLPLHHGTPRQGVEGDLLRAFLRSGAPSLDAATASRLGWKAALG